MPKKKLLHRPSRGESLIRKLRTFKFHIVLDGTGEDADEAWRDAVAGFEMDPGPTPDKDKITEED